MIYVAIKNDRRSPLHRLFSHSLITQSGEKNKENLLSKILLKSDTKYKKVAEDVRGVQN